MDGDGVKALKSTGQIGEGKGSKSTGGAGARHILRIYVCLSAD